MKEKTDLRILKTQKALCDAFMEMLDEKLFDSITVNELCERAMVRRATFYKHFEDKYDFFAFFIRQMQAKFSMELRPYMENEGDLYEYHLSIFSKCVDFFEEHKRLIDNVLKSNMFSVLIDIFSEEIYRTIYLQMTECERKNIVFPAQIEIIASFYTGGIVQTLRFWVNNKDKMGKEELISGVTAMLQAIKVLE